MRVSLVGLRAQSPATYVSTRLGTRIGTLGNTGRDVLLKTRGSS